MRPRRPPLRLLPLLAALASACASAPPTTAERIAGRLRERPYASATAYEAFLRAELAAARGDFAEADRQMNLAAFADEADPWIAARRVQHLASAGQRTRAVELAREATRRHAGSSAVWLSLATALGDAPSTLAERDAALARAVGLDPGDAEVRATAVRIASRHAATDAAPARPPSPADPVERLAEAGAWSQAAAWVAAHARREAPDDGDRLSLAVTRACAGDLPGARAAVGVLSRRRGAVDRTAVAWLWLRAGELPRAMEESALGMTEGVTGAAAVRAIALAEADRPTEALRVAALVRVDDRAPVVAPLSPAPWAGRCARSGPVGRAEGMPRGSALAWVTASVAASLDRAGRGDLADLLVARSMTRLQALGADGLDARDDLRQRAAARLERLGRGDDARAALASAEGVGGRLARAALHAWEGPGPLVEADLTAAAAAPEAAVWAAAWRVLHCARAPGRCAQPEVEAAERTVLAAMDEAPVVARARALSSRDAAALGRAAEADPRSPWDAWIVARPAPVSTP